MANPTNMVVIIELQMLSLQRTYLPYNHSSYREHIMFLPACSILVLWIPFTRGDGALQSMLAQEVYLHK